MPIRDAPTRAAAVLRRPPVYAFLVLGLVLLAILVRLALVPGANDVFDGHADSKQYFVKAYGEFLHGFYYPLAHGASGWPLLLALALRAFGFVGTSGFSMSMDAPYDQEGADAIVFAYAFHAALAGLLALATWLLARRLVGRLAAAAATLLVAIDPFLLSQSTTVMADQLFALLAVGALAAVVAARRNLAWLVVAGALVALSHVVRVNGLLLLPAIVAVAAVCLRPRFRAWHAAIPIAAFLLVAAPYLAWRAEHLPGAFDYGTNQRFWTDDPWDFEDAYWQGYSYADGGPRESAADYFAAHSLAEAASRLYRSIQGQLLDITSVALSPTLLLLAALGAAAARRERWTWMVPIVAATLLATFVWTYPVVRSPRYFLVLVPLAAVLAAAGLERLARRPRGAWLAAGLLAVPIALHGVEPIARLPDALALVDAPGVAPMVALLASLAALVVLPLGLRAGAPGPAEEPTAPIRIRT